MPPGTDPRREQLINASAVQVLLCHLDTADLTGITSAAPAPGTEISTLERCHDTTSLGYASAGIAAAVWAGLDRHQDSIGLREELRATVERERNMLLEGSGWLPRLR